MMLFLLGALQVFGTRVFDRRAMHAHDPDAFAIMQFTFYKFLGLVENQGYMCDFKFCKLGVMKNGLWTSSGYIIATSNVNILHPFPIKSVKTLDHDTPGIVWKWNNFWVYGRTIYSIICLKQSIFRVVLTIHCHLVFQIFGHLLRLLFQGLRKSRWQLDDWLSVLTELASELLVAIRLWDLDLIAWKNRIYTHHVVSSRDL